MRIAVVTDDGKTVSRHFGRATYFMVAAVENGQIVAREMRQKVGHRKFANDPHEAAHHGQYHGTGPHAQTRHDQMLESIRDCDALICGGMGYGAYESVKQHGIRPIISDIDDVEQAVLACAEGRIVDHVDRLH
jgi:predicted Fe-Mo cluster-binding NifX family protein